MAKNGGGGITGGRRTNVQGTCTGLEEILKFKCSLPLPGLTCDGDRGHGFTSHAIPMTDLGLLRVKEREELCLLRLGSVSEIWRKQS